jgi:hypothetical protein
MFTRVFVALSLLTANESTYATTHQCRPRSAGTPRPRLLIIDCAIWSLPILKLSLELQKIFIQISSPFEIFSAEKVK